MGKLEKIFTFGIIGGLILTSQYVHADKCDEISFCRLENIPRMNQNDEGLTDQWVTPDNNLCGPTALSSLLMGTIKHSKNIVLKPSSWIDSFYNLPSNSEKIKSSALKIIELSQPPRALENLLREGTYPEELFSLIQNSVIDLTPVPYYYYSGFGISYKSMCSFINNIRGYSPYNMTNLRNKMGMIVQFGHYQMSSQVSFGVTQKTYTRQGGHFVVIYGYTENRLDLLEVDPVIGNSLGLFENSRLSRIYGTVKSDSGMTLEYNSIYYNGESDPMKLVNNAISANSVGYLWDKRDEASNYFPIIESIIYLGTTGD